MAGAMKLQTISLKRILLILSLIGPGLITSIVDNDAGGIATMSTAGAHYGYSILWYVFPVTIVLILVQEMVARMGVVTGKGLSDLIRENFGLRTTLFIMILVFCANLFIIISEFSGIAAAGELFSISKYVLVPIVVVLVLFSVLRFDYKSIEKLFLVLCFFYISYIISGFLAHPDWSAAFRGVISPTFSFSPGYILLLIGLIGTTITPWMQFYLQSTVVEKGIQIRDYKFTKMEIIGGSVITNIIAFFIMLACAATLFANGVNIETADDAARALAPLAGNYASLLFGIGLFSASLAAAFILPLATSFQVCEALGWESSISKDFKQAPQFYSILIILVLLGSGVTLIPGISLFKIMIAAQVFNGVALPFILIFMLLLVNNKKIMGQHTNPKFYNIVCWATVVMVMLLSFFAGILPLLGYA